MASNKYNDDFLGKRAANFTPLTPISFIERTARVHPHHTAIIDGDLRQSWGDTYRRCRKAADALIKRGVCKDDTIAVLCPNTAAAVEVAFSVPLSGGVLNMINTRLDAASLAFILDHGEATVFMVDQGLSDLAAAALELADVKPLVIDIEDSTLGEPGAAIGSLTYEDLIAEGDACGQRRLPEDEWDAIALNYTSGTTGNPKGVVYHHRGAYLNGLGEGVEWALPHHPVYLWTLPLFHCNGWCFPWTVAAYAGTNVCLRAPEAGAILDSIKANNISHMCGAPIILNMVTTEAESRGEKLPWPVKMMTAGAAPPAAVLARSEAIGFDVIHVYGLTEVYGPTGVCAWKQQWNELPADQQAELKSRQGVPYVVQEEMVVLDSDTLQATAMDGQTMGEIMFRGNAVMKGYLKNPEATEKAFAGGYFHSEDLAVVHPDNYAEIKDRSKDIIISGGENISSIEVEGVLYRLPCVATAAVVAAPDEKWGETPWAFIELAEGQSATCDEVIAFCREHLARFKCPSHVVFGDIPKTSTGKIQKFELRKKIAEQLRD